MVWRWESQTRNYFYSKSSLSNQAYSFLIRPLHSLAIICNWLTYLQRICFQEHKWFKVHFTWQSIEFLCAKELGKIDKDRKKQQSWQFWPLSKMDFLILSSIFCQKSQHLRDEYGALLHFHHFLHQSVNGHHRHCLENLVLSKNTLFGASKLFLNKRPIRATKHKLRCGKCFTITG